MAEQTTLGLPPTKKKKRVPLSGTSRNILGVRNKDPGFRYRWVNVTNDRILRFQDAGYDPVTRDALGDGEDARVDTSKGTSSIAEKGVGMGMKAILMRIPKEFYEEDQRAKQERVDEIEASMKREAKKDRYGKFEVTSGPLGNG
jgi:hypothetical protein